MGAGRAACPFQPRQRLARPRAEVAALIREREIDIVVDLQGYTADCRAGIFAHRAAPVQVDYLAYPGTLGAPYVDYLIADRRVVPTEHFAYYSEKVVHLPHCYQPNGSGREVAPVAPARAQASLPERGFVFCSFNGSYKITPEIFDVWVRLLRSVPESVLWLLDENEVATRNLRREAAVRRVEPDRLVFAPRVPLAAHLARYPWPICSSTPSRAMRTRRRAMRSGLGCQCSRAWARRSQGASLRVCSRPLGCRSWLPGILMNMRRLRSLSRPIPGGSGRCAHGLPLSGRPAPCSILSATAAASRRPTPSCGSASRTTCRPFLSPCSIG